MEIIEYLIVGSGCSGAMAAQTLVEAGASVTMVDVGSLDSGIAAHIPNKDFLSIRRSDPEQYRYLLGEKAESAQWTDIGKAAQIMPPRKHMLKGVDQYLPLQSSTFSPVESLGYGGLGIGWGLQCWEYSEHDMQKAGLHADKMYPAYEVVAERIGISGSADLDSRYTLGRLSTHQSAPTLDRNHQEIYKRYGDKRSRMNSKGLYMSRTPLAMITEDVGDRKAYAYKDMDYYSDRDKSAWRPWITVDQLRTHKNFHYLGGHLAVKFLEKDGITELSCLKTEDNSQVTLFCRNLILATNPLSSARIALRSLGDAESQVPILCNPYTYVPCLQPEMIGKGAESKKLGLAQLSLFLDTTGDNAELSVASLYAYQSLMMFRTVRQVPFGFSDSQRLLQYLMPAIVIMGIHHPDRQSRRKFLKLIPDTTTPTGDVLTAEYSLDADELREYGERERALIAAMRALGVYALKKINPGNGASIHYAGTLPFSEEERPLHLSPEGRIYGTERVYVADSSGFTYLPARGLTFSLMANAHLTAQEVLRHA